MAAVVDPEVTYSLPPAITAATGLDALTQLIEPFVSNAANPVTDALCREGMQRVATMLPRAFHDGSDAQARADMSLASLFGGLTLANARLGAVHGMAGPLGGVLAAPHGAICARLLPIVMEANVKALEKREPDSEVLSRYREVARLLTGRESASLTDGIQWAQALCRELKISSLSELGLNRQMIPGIAAQARKSSSMRGNPIVLSEPELEEVLERALN
jgi:alcohol dehydrogenase class IV